MTIFDAAARGITDGATSQTKGLFPVLVIGGGLALAASALILLFSTTETHNTNFGMRCLLLAVVLIWLGPGLSVNNYRAQLWYLRLSLAFLCAMAVNAVYAGFPDVTLFFATHGTFGPYLMLGWTLGLVAPLGLAVLLLYRIPAVLYGWHLLFSAICGILILTWGWLAVMQMQTQNYLLPVLTVLVLPSGVLTTRWLAQWHRQDSIRHPGPKPRRPMPRVAPSFRNLHQELWAKGRFCELFELPCSGSCPLATSVASKYQQLRLQYQQDREMLDILEKAYGMLVTPRQRALCNIAHDIMRVKAAEWGGRKFAIREAYLWQEVWAALNSGDIKGDPDRALKAKAGLINEL